LIANTVCPHHITSTSKKGLVERAPNAEVDHHLGGKASIENNRKAVEFPCGWFGYEAVLRQR